MSKPKPAPAKPVTPPATPPGSPDAPAKKGKGKLLLLAVPLVLVLVGAGLWFSGVLPHLLGMGAKPAVAAVAPGAKLADAAPPPPKPPVFVDMPELVANLNAGRRTSFIKLHARLEVARPEDQAVVLAAMPRLQDLFQTYLREMQPDELRGSAGTWRLREELIARANVAVDPARVTAVLFTEMLVQ